ncbi:hypothetical protein BDN67DRAFT_965485 [Paxillus ammoniavirescens]|nr:hypothetical protein BDN67DRAFT_965485 [Paxillus ammoniavirescens]
MSTHNPAGSGMRETSQPSTTSSASPRTPSPTCTPTTSTMTTHVIIHPNSAGRSFSAVTFTLYVVPEASEASCAC